MSDRRSAVVLSASSEIDDHVVALSNQLLERVSSVSIVAPGPKAKTESIRDEIAMHTVPLIPSAPRELAQSESSNRVIRWAGNRLLRGPWRLVTGCLWIDRHWALLDYPELVARATELRPSAVCADGREMLKAAHQIAKSCEVELIYVARDEQSDERTGAARFAWFHRPLLAIREVLYRPKAAIRGRSDGTLS